MTNSRNLTLRVAAGVVAMLTIFAAGQAFAGPGPGGHGPEHQPGPGPHPHHVGPPDGPFGYCGIYPEFLLMRHPIHGDFGYFFLDGGHCLWVEGPPPRHVRSAPPPPTVVVVPQQPAQTQTQTQQQSSSPPTASSTDYCREYQDRITVGDKEVDAYGTACMQPDGAWKLKQGKTPTAADHCREFRRTTTVDGKEQEQTGTACLRPGDVWEIVTTN